MKLKMLDPVRYHGSMTAMHGSDWLYNGPCTCDRCNATDLDDAWLYELITLTGKTLLCVRRASFTRIEETP